MIQLKEGQKAPDFKCNNQDGKLIALKDFKGKKVILYFYPKDNTPGCTAESCNLRDNYNEIRKKGYEIVGVSCDSEKSHLKFIQKFNLPFTLLADTDKKIVQAYGVWNPKSFLGRTFLGIHRTTFIISENGIIEKIIRKVETKTHSNQVLASNLV